MTIATRNRFIRLALVGSIALVVVTVAATVLILARKTLPSEIPGPRPLAVLSAIAPLAWSPRAALISICVYPIFSAVFLAYTLIAFEKTQTVEITFFATAVFAVALESIRVFIPFYGFWAHSSFYAEAISRVAYFSRFAVIILLLASGIYANGQAVQQLASSIFLIAFFAFGIANSIPIDTSFVDSNFFMKSGYEGMILLFFSLIGFMSVLPYLILGKTRGVREYSRAGFGALSFLLGFGLLGVCDSWIFLIGGTVLLFVGATAYLTQMRNYYLWQ